ncbi:competence protein, partial [Mycobacteroides abscessus]|nr:competence protein [Mycobacteroides abscessus]
SVSMASIAANVLAGLVIVPITVLGTAAAALTVVSPQVAGLLARFCGPELWWLLRVADYASAGGTTAIPVPAGVLGFAVVAVLLGIAVWLWRRRWFRGLVWTGVLCALALMISARVVS